MPEPEAAPPVPTKVDAIKAQTTNNVKRYEEVYTECLGGARRIAERRGWGDADDERVMKLADTLFDRFLDDQLAAQKSRVLNQYAGNLLELLQPLLNGRRL